MLARLRKSMDEKDQGFTLIELLVVMIIIGILAAIAIPVFLSQRQKARDTAAKADVSTIGKELASYFVDGVAAPTVTVTAGRYVIQGNDAGAQSNGIGLITGYGATTTTGASLTTTGMTATAWCVAVKDGGSGATIYKYSATNGLATGNCSAANGS